MAIKQDSNLSAEVESPQSNVIVELRECPKHGPFKAVGHRVFDKIVWSKCPICDQNRIKRTKDYALHLQAREKLDSVRRTFGYWVPNRFCHSGFNQFKIFSVEQFDVLETTKNYVQHFEANHRKGLGLTFIGGTGTGKTMLASCILTALYPTFVGAYVYFPGLLARMQQVRSVPKDGITEAKIESALTNSPLLVLDEIGAVDRKEEAGLLLRVVDARYSAKLPTIYISNLTKKDFEQVFDERIVSRMAQVNTCVKFDWKDWRRQ